MESVTGGPSAAGGDEGTTPHLALVHHVVTETLRRVPDSVTQDELTAAALAALAEAGRAYEPAVHGDVHRYVEQRIRAAVVDLLRSIDWQARARQSGPAPDRGRFEAARRALATLPDQQRAVIEGYFLDQRALSELATDLQLDEHEVARLRTDALQALRRTLAPALTSVGRDYRAATGRPRDRLGAGQTFAVALPTG
jgi:RNA polymerase sigma factor (sigma-70 family)